MGKLELLQCKTCGGHIDRYTLTCQSCGSIYRLTEDFVPIRILPSEMQIATIGGSSRTSREDIFVLGEKNASEMTLRHMAEIMAEKLLPYIEFQTSLDPRNGDIVTFGRLRVVNPIK